MKKLIAIILVLVMAGTSCGATTYYVSQDGSNGDALSWATAKTTIDAVKRIAPAGSTVDVNSGTYAETVTDVNGLTFDGLDGTAIISHANSAAGIVLANNTKLKNLSIVLTSLTSGAICISGTSVSNISIENCTTTGGSDGIWIKLCSNVSIKDSNITSGYDSIYCYSSTGVFAENTRFTSYGTYSTAVNARGVMVGGVDGVAEMTLNNCIITSSKPAPTTISPIGVLTSSGATKKTVFLNNCSISAYGYSTTTGGASAIKTDPVLPSGSPNANIIINNCTLTSSSTGSGSVLDIQNNTNNIGWVCVKDSSYNFNKTSGKITVASRTRSRGESPYWDGRR